jgi:hypothetical protein
MTKNENIQRIKNEALNKIAKIYHPKYKFPYSDYPGDGSYASQRDFEIESIINNMNKQIQAVKDKERKKNEIQS